MKFHLNTFFCWFYSKWASTQARTGGGDNRDPSRLPHLTPPRVPPAVNIPNLPKTLALCQKSAKLQKRETIPVHFSNTFFKTRLNPFCLRCVLLLFGSSFAKLSILRRPLQLQHTYKIKHKKFTRGLPRYLHWLKNHKALPMKGHGVRHESYPIKSSYAQLKNYC